MASVAYPEFVRRIDALLPQTQCRRCGYDACLPYAEAIAAGDAINRCPPGGDAVIGSLATLTGRLVVPLDTHVVRVGRCLGLTRYSSPGWRMAHDMTASLRQLDPADPVKYDYALCHLGMMNACGFAREPRSSTRRGASPDAQCPLRGWCRPRAHTRAPSRPPSGRR